jgi:hypothetical protein
MKVGSGTNQPEVINGREFAGHALDEMQAEGIPSSAVENTIQHGVQAPAKHLEPPHTLDGLGCDKLCRKGYYRNVSEITCSTLHIFKETKGRLR